MPLAIKNNAIIIKDGRLAENCNCCGEWYCYSEYGCCVVNGVATSKCEAECIAAGGTFSGVGSKCCSEVGSILLQRPASIILSFGGSPPAAYGHGCPANPSGDTRDGTWDGTAGWTPLNVFELNNWPASMALTPGNGLTFSYGGWAGGDAPSSAAATISCSHVDSSGKVVWQIDSIAIESHSRRACVGWLSPTEFRDGSPGVSSALSYKLNALCAGNSASGFSVASQTPSAQNVGGSGAGTALRPQPIFCNLNISGWNITGVAFS